MNGSGFASQGYQLSLGRSSAVLPKALSGHATWFGQGIWPNLPNHRSRLHSPYEPSLSLASCNASRGAVGNRFVRVQQLSPPPPLCAAWPGSSGGMTNATSGLRGRVAKLVSRLFCLCDVLKGALGGYSLQVELGMLAIEERLTEMRFMRRRDIKTQDYWGVWFTR